MEAFVYILLFSNGQFYVGFTTDLKRRLVEHARGKVESTAKRRPLRLIHYEWYALESDARRREHYLKTTEGRHFLRQQIRDLYQAVEAGSPHHPMGRPVG